MVVYVEVETGDYPIGYPDGGALAIRVDDGLVRRGGGGGGGPACNCGMCGREVRGQRLRAPDACVQRGGNSGGRFSGVA